MRRAALAVLASLTICCAAAPALAACADDVQDAMRQLPQVKDAQRHKELALLLDKAAKDAAAGRERLCRDAVVRAQSLSHGTP